MHAPGLLVVTTLLAGGLVTVGSQALGLSYPRFREVLGRKAPEGRAHLLSLVAGLPLLLAIGTLVLTFLPSFITIPGLIQDHCLPHDHHPHLCLRHGLWAPSGQAWVILVVLGLAGGAFWVRFLRRLIEGQRQVRTLLRLAKEAGEFHLLPSRKALAFSAGLLRPRTLLSSMVMTSLDHADLKVLLAHETAHAKRRDALRLVIAEAMLMAVPRRIRRMLLDDLSLACEEACDRAALPQAGCPERMAEVLLRVQRLGMMATPAGQPGATGSQLPLRVRALLGDPYPPTPSWTRLLWFSPLLLLLADPVHHAAETLLGLLNP
ncbi:MAG: M56 family metallopeptidase [Acidobacteria bacterium]|nr:M56 family metallopeptidase [Acidobacteriota bacterium]MBI3487164.1 M56 family metallopeptidase [Acidobacteriota bacterium]